MKSLLLMTVLFVSAVCLLSCSDDDPVTPPPPPLVQKGPFVVDFEDRPDDGFVGKTTPVTIAPGITVASVLPAGLFYDFRNSDGWGLGGCDATVFSDSMMIGFSGSGGAVTGVITFDTAVSRVDLFGGAFSGGDLIVTAFDSMDNVVGADTTASVCPTVDANDLLSIDAGANTISRIEVSGVVPVMNDLTFFRFE